MSDANIKVGYQAIENALSALRETRKQLQETLDEHNKLINELPKCFGGTNGEQAYKNLTKHSEKHFENYLKDFDVRIDFAEKVAKAYENMENERMARIEELSNVNTVG